MPLTTWKGFRAVAVRSDAALAALLLALALPAAAAERVVTGVSADTVALNVTFASPEILVFGAISRDAPVPEGAGPLDIVVTLKGPPERVVVRRKDRVLGLWVNAAAVRVRGAPSFYAVAATRPVAEILSETERLRYAIGIDQAVRLFGSHPTIADTGAFATALARIRLAEGRFSLLENGGVGLEQDTLFQARFVLPADLVEGTYAAEVFLVRDGQVISAGMTRIEVRLAGIERWIYNLSREAPFVYGLFAIAVALAAGWLAAFGFRLIRR